MYDNLVVNIAQLKEGGEGANGNGCILAHCMGLGKTLQARGCLEKWDRKTSSAVCIRQACGKADALPSRHRPGALWHETMPKPSEPHARTATSWTMLVGFLVEYGIFRMYGLMYGGCRLVSTCLSCRGVSLCVPPASRP